MNALQYLFFFLFFSFFHSVLNLRLKWEKKREIHWGQGKEIRREQKGPRKAYAAPRND